MSRSFRNSTRKDCRSLSNVGNTQKKEMNRIRGNISQVETSQDQYREKGDGKDGSVERNQDELRRYKKYKDSHQHESHSRSRTLPKHDNSNSSTTRQSFHNRNLNNPLMISNTLNSNKSDSLQQQATLQLKRYRSLIDQQHLSFRSSLYPTNLPKTSTTKLDMMILFQQLKQQLHIEQIEKSIEQNVHATIQKWKHQTSLLQQKNHQLYEPICDIDLMFQSQQSVLAKWSDHEEMQKRKQAIQQLEKERIRQRSPLSNRFRMMHECQTNDRRMRVQMACMFLNIQVFYYLQDLEIIKVQEIIFSDNQEIVVLKAYTVEYQPKMGMMKIEPKLKTLISVYKFSGLQELIRLEKTYGRFDGIVVYPESFDIRKYLMNNKQLSLVNEKYLKDIKAQVQSVQQDEEPALTKEQKISY